MHQEPGSLTVLDGILNKYSICRRQGKEFEQSYQQGKPTTELTETPLPRKAAKQTGTQIRFLYDKQVFSTG